jgi:hypothetical protein
MTAKLACIGILILAAPFTSATTDVSSSILDRGKVITELNKSGQLGVGFVAGSQSGLSAEYWTAESRALAGTLALEHQNVVVGLTHQWMFRGAFPGDLTPLTPFVGAGLLEILGRRPDGLRRQGGGDAVTAVQLPLGFVFLDRRWGFFAEAAPCFEFLPVFHDFIFADLGARYYF